MTERLEFGNEEHIAKINRDIIVDKVRNDDEFQELQIEYRRIENKKDELEEELDDTYDKISKIALKKGISKNDIWKLI